MLPRLLAAALAACLLLPVGARAASPPSLLFVQQTDGGTLTRTGAKTYRLTLRGVAPSVSSFTDRPARTASSEPAAAFVSRWAGRGFAKDPPNAALVLDGAPNGADVAMLTLSRPRYRAATREFTYVARPLKGTPGRALKDFTRRRDPLRERRFGAGSLFIDDASGLVYQQLTLQIANAQPGQQISVRLTPSGTPVGFSSGPSLNSAAGVQVNGQSGTLPLADLSLTDTTLRVITSTGGGFGGVLSFSLSLYLVAESPITTFYLASQSDPGIVVTAQLGPSQPQVINQAQTLFPWNPA